MRNVPISIVDNFFPNPDAVVALAGEQHYEYDASGAWPGKVTDRVHTFDPSFFQYTVNRILNLLYEDPQKLDDYVCHLLFQKIPSNYGAGWVHTDNSLITAVIYLSKDAPISSGTSFYRLKKDQLYPRKLHMDKKIALNSGRASIDQVRPFLEESNAQYEETIRVGNIYNRLFIFDSSVFHAAQDFPVSGEADRLTLVGFFNKIHANTPIQRMGFIY